jgi:hypothetical protein
MRSARLIHSTASALDGWADAMARRPAAQISRLWVQGWLSISQIPASGSVHRLAMAAEAASAALHPSVSSRSSLAAAAKSRSDSPKASSWNCRLTQLPTMSEPPG